MSLPGPGHNAQKSHGRHERGCETRCLCAMSEAYDQNNQGPIVVPCASGGDHVAPGHVVHAVGRIVWRSQWCSQAQ